MGYLITNNSKSFNILYPLLELKRDDKVEKNIDTYLYWTETDESIDEYLFIVLYRFSSDDVIFNNYKSNIINNKNLSNCYSTNLGEVFIFNFFDRIETVDNFINGKYSKIINSDKELIMKFNNTPLINKKCTLVSNKPLYPMHVILYPEYYLEDIAKELGITEDYMKSIGETFSKFDINYETLDCNIVDKCHINYDQLSLKL
jgi:hypothetical protein